MLVGRRRSFCTSAPGRLVGRAKKHRIVGGCVERLEKPVSKVPGMLRIGRGPGSVSVRMVRLMAVKWDGMGRDGRRRRAKV